MTEIKPEELEEFKEWLEKRYKPSVVRYILAGLRMTNPRSKHSLAQVRKAKRKYNEFLRWRARGGDEEW